MQRGRRRHSRAAARILPWLLVPFAVVLPATPAHAACHAFAVDVSPGAVTEGGTVTVTVSRDADVAPSQVDVSTVDGTARAGQDYVAVRRTVVFDSGTSQSFPLTTTDDGADETDERFSVRLSNPGGCPPNTNYQLGPDAVVTVRDNDAPPQASPRPTSASPRPQTTRPAPRTTAPVPRTTTPAPRTTAPAPRTTAPRSAPTAAATSAAASDPDLDYGAPVPTGSPPSAITSPPTPGSSGEADTALSSSDEGLPGGPVAVVALLAGVGLATLGAARLRRRRRIG